MCGSTEPARRPPPASATASSPAPSSVRICTNTSPAKSATSIRTAIPSFRAAARRCRFRASPTPSSTICWFTSTIPPTASGPTSRSAPAAKYYRTTGPEPSDQSLSQFATLMRQNQWKFVTSLGFGVKYRLLDHMLLRADFHDYISPFPRAVFAPAQGATDRGLFQQFTPTIGVSYWF